MLAIRHHAPLGPSPTGRCRQQRADRAFAGEPSAVHHDTAANAQRRLLALICACSAAALAEPPTRLGSRGSVWRRCRTRCVGQRHWVPLPMPTKARAGTSQSLRKRSISEAAMELSSGPACSDGVGAVGGGGAWPPDRRQPGIAPRSRISSRSVTRQSIKLDMPMPRRSRRRARWLRNIDARVPARPGNCVDEGRSMVVNTRVRRSGLAGRRAHYADATAVGPADECRGRRQ